MDITNKSSPISIDNLKRKNIFDNHQYIPKEYKELASDMESQFAKLMLEQMNNTVDRSESENEYDPAPGIYRDLLTNEHADLISKNNGGLGLQEVVLNQIYPQKFRNKANYDAYLEQMNQRHLIGQKNKNQRADLDKTTINNSMSAKEISND